MHKNESQVQSQRKNKHEFPRKQKNNIKFKNNKSMFSTKLHVHCPGQTLTPKTYGQNWNYINRNDQR